MSDFKVGDRVRNGVYGTHLYLVTAVSVMANGDQIISLDEWNGKYSGEVWHHAAAFTLVPPEKPKYQLAHNKWDGGESGQVEAILDTPNLPYSANAVYGPRRAAQTREQAEAMVRAAMAVVGYEEEV